MTEPQPWVPLKVCWKCKKEQETASSPFCKKGSPRGSLLPSRICPSNRRLRQRRCRRCILLLMLSEDGLEAMVLWAGELSSAQLPGALLLVLLAVYLSFQPVAFTFFWEKGWEVATTLATGRVLIS